MKNIYVILIICIFMIFVVVLAVYFVEYNDKKIKEINAYHEKYPDSIKVLTIDGDTAIISNDCGHLVIKLQK